MQAQHDDATASTDMDVDPPQKLHDIVPAVAPLLEPAQTEARPDEVLSNGFPNVSHEGVDIPGSGAPNSSGELANGSKSGISTDTIPTVDPQNDTIAVALAATPAPTTQPLMATRPLGPPAKRPIGRPKGSKTRGVTKALKAGGQKGKRKRKSDEADEDNTSDSEVATPTASMTKSGRAIQKPTTFVPPAQPSPQATPVYKRKKPAQRKNPESAVCKICLRGVSPASNMIVFCDGCNTPYHRWCHKPLIDQAVIDEVDKEWFCRTCERERIEPVPEVEVLGFVAAGGASAIERQKYFSSLPPGLLVTLLTRATTLQPDLPLFEPTFEWKPSAASTGQPTHTNGHAHPPNPSSGTITAKAPQLLQPKAMIIRDMDDEDGYGSDVHPTHYPRPGQGFMSTLPPESEDLHFLVDDQSSRGVFTHLYQTAPGAQEAAASAGVHR